MEPPIPFDEDTRLKRLEALGILDTDANGRIDALTARALAAFPGASMAAVSLVTRDRQWFKSAIGLAMTQTPRSVSFCAHTIMGSRNFIVPDAAADRRFAANSLVTGGPGIRFYAGACLLDGLGALCVIGTEPRRPSPAELALLSELARLVETQILVESTLRLLANPLSQHEAISASPNPMHEPLTKVPSC